MQPTEYSQRPALRQAMLAAIYKLNLSSASWFCSMSTRKLEVEPVWHRKWKEPQKDCQQAFPHLRFYSAANACDALSVHDLGPCCNAGGYGQEVGCSSHRNRGTRKESRKHVRNGVLHWIRSLLLASVHGQAGDSNFADNGSGRMTHYPELLAVSKCGWG